MRRSNEKFSVYLDGPVREGLEALCRKQGVAAATARRARILLLADEAHAEGRRADWEIAEMVGLSERQVMRIRQKFVRAGVVPAIERQKRSTPGTPFKFDGKAEARLVTLCLSDPPQGHQRWTLQLLVDEACRLQIVASVCRETIRKCLKKISSSPGRASGSAFRRETGRGSWPIWRGSSMCTAKGTTKSTR